MTDQHGWILDLFYRMIIGRTEFARWLIKQAIVMALIRMKGVSLLIAYPTGYDSQVWARAVTVWSMMVLVKEIDKEINEHSHYPFTLFPVSNLIRSGAKHFVSSDFWRNNSTRLPKRRLIYQEGEFHRNHSFVLIALARHSQLMDSVPWYMTKSRAKTKVNSVFWGRFTEKSIQSPSSCFPLILSSSLQHELQVSSLVFSLRKKILTLFNCGN